jgi:glucose/arabinose dehydrogenase
MGTQNGITKRSEPGMEQPVVYYTPTIAPSGITFYTGKQFPNWQNSLFVTALRGEHLRRLEITDRQVTHQEVLFEQFGRVRDVVNGPDGNLYVLLQNPTGGSSGVPLSGATPGAIVRLVPAE